eukprot:290763-Pleurochrysis_carterae.AAC.1
MLYEAKHAFRDTAKKGCRGSTVSGQRANSRYSVAAEANAGEDARGMEFKLGLGFVPNVRERAVAFLVTERVQGFAPNRKIWQGLY